MEKKLKKIFSTVNGKETQIFVTFFIIYFISLAIFGINRPIWHDEGHFYETIKYFGSTPFFEALYSYEEMSTPLPFFLFSLWGKIFGFSLQVLRIFNMIIAALTYLLLFSFFIKFIPKKIALLFLVFIALNPYYAGASIFVFTDMIAIMFMFLAFYSLVGSKPILLFVGLVGALLSRQYLLFLIPPFLAYCLFKFIANRDKSALLNTISITLSCIPLLVLFVYWKGTCPNNEVKELYLNNAFTFHWEALVLYLSQIVLYVLPFSLYYNRNVFTNKKTIIGSLLISSIYIIAPVRASPAAVEISRLTVGYLNRAVEVFGVKGLSHVVFYIGLLFAIPVLLYWFKILWVKLQTSDFDIVFLSILTMISFLFVMPFSYLLWEKYFIPVLPLVLLLFYMCNRGEHKEYNT